LRNADDLSNDEYQALADFRHTLRKFQAFSEARALECGLSPQQHQALLAIRGAGDNPVTIGFIAQRLILKPHSATGLINRLEAMNLVERRISSEDRRHALLALKPKAVRLLKALSETHRQEILRLKPMLAALLERLG
jgi:DNA-binding MarR family transcriptional regulator